MFSLLAFDTNTSVPWSGNCLYRYQLIFFLPNLAIQICMHISRDDKPKIYIIDRVVSRRVTGTFHGERSSEQPVHLYMSHQEIIRM